MRQLRMHGLNLPATTPRNLLLLAALAFTGFSGCHEPAASPGSGAPAGVLPLPDAWRPMPAVAVEGILGERLELWRQRRLWRVIDDPYLLGGFVSRPGSHPWQGEHVGKWMHAATLACENTRDPRLEERLRETARRLAQTQEDNGYLGTYAPEKRFYAPFNEFTKTSWDIWTHRYVLYGLLTYEKYHPDPPAVEACTRIGDLLLDTFGPGKADLTQIGTRRGISSSTLLESIVMLYERTRDKRFLEFAEHILDLMERNDGLRLESAMLAGEDVSGPGDGKAYQLMACLLGFGDLYRNTGKRDYLDAAIKGWENIREHHIYETGGPWSYKSLETQNKECFALPRFFHPSNVVENCSTTTWIQLSLLLQRVTGEARYGVEAEKAVLNQLFGAQSPNGIDWAYYTALNCSRREYEDKITCCASSGPRALETYAAQLAGLHAGVVSLNSYLPMSIPLQSRTGEASRFVIDGNYPFEEEVRIRFEAPAASDLTLDLILPSGVGALHVSVDGSSQSLEQMPSGYQRLRRTWKPGDTARVKLDFLPRAHFHRDRDGIRWVDFTYGPWALAQAAEADRDIGIPVQAESEDASLWIETAGEGASTLSFRLKGTGALLVPYYQAGSSGGGVRTLFRVL